MTVAQAVSFAAMRSANIAVEVRHLLKKPDVLEQRRTRSPSCCDVLVVVDGGRRILW
jgi:hypothetical protein